MDKVNGWTITREHGGFTLTDPEGDFRMIGGQGHVASTYRAAALEREHRIDMDRDAVATTTARYRVPDTRRQRALVAAALREMRRDALLERVKWTSYAAAAREAGVL